MNHAYFIASPSPGAVFRFLERLARHDEHAPETLLLSDAVGPEHWRLLVPDSDGWLLGRVPQLAAAFPPSVLWLDRIGARWRRWEADGTTEAGLAPPARRRLLLPPPSAAQIWAKAQGLPYERLIKPPRLLDYETVAQLDQRSLLLEDTPRLYRFVLREVQ